jgi:RHS repeat-associated protein
MDDPAGNKDHMGYTGHIEDTASGLTYMQARYYDPVIGRFLSIDPVGFVESGNNAAYFNRYAYAGNDPVNSIDPDGQQFIGTTGPLVRYSEKATTAYVNVDIQATIIFGLSVDLAAGVAVERQGTIPTGVQAFISHTTIPSTGASNSAEVASKGYHGAVGANAGLMNGNLSDMNGTVDATNYDIPGVGASSFSPNIGENSGVGSDALAQVNDFVNGVPGAGVEVGIGEGLGVSQGHQTTRPLVSMRTPLSNDFEEKDLIELGN